MRKQSCCVRRSSSRAHQWSSALASIAVLFAMTPADAVDFEQMAHKFAESGFVFNRARSDVPFVPLAWLDVAAYDSDLGADGYGSLSLNFRPSL